LASSPQDRASIVNFGKVELLTLCDGHGEVDLVDLGPEFTRWDHGVPSHDPAMAVIKQLGIHWQTLKRKFQTTIPRVFGASMGFPPSKSPSISSRGGPWRCRSLLRGGAIFSMFFFSARSGANSRKFDNSMSDWIW
jgi:hypothetical protein